MWVTKNSGWNKNSTKLEKFLFERLIQRCDYNETISKKHRTINGYTQLRELIQLGELTKERIKTLRPLKAIIQESKSKHIKQNILNDIIIKKYFKDLRDYIAHFDEENYFKNDTLTKINEFIYTLKKFSHQLEKRYFDKVKIELQTIDFTESKELRRNLEKISDLVDIIIPLLLYQGYSISTLNQVLRRWIEKKYRLNLEKFLKFFDKRIANYEIIILLGNDSSEISDLKNVIYKIGEGDIRKSNEFSKDFIPTKTFHQRSEAIYYNCTTTDPVSFIRDKYVEILKAIVIHRDRKSLSLLTSFFKNSYWKKTSSGHSYYTNIKINGDPISVISRKGTLFSSLVKNQSLDFNEKSSIDFLKNEQLKKSVYYYNLALGSKSIENSLSLLWTSVETILPYRVYKSDIKSIKDLFSKIYSFGTICRDIQYIIDRIIVVSKINNNCIKGLKKLPNNNTGDELLEWYSWLIHNPIEKFKSFEKASELLAYEYSKAVKPIVEGKLSYLINRINSSKWSIDFQLERIYLHRNQIVHSGDYINEYTNLWIHLEWYIGKFLYYIILQTEISQKEIDIQKLFRNLESDFEFIYSYIEKNKEKKCADNNKIITELLKIDWQ